MYHCIVLFGKSVCHVIVMASNGALFAGMEWGSSRLFMGTSGMRYTHNIKSIYLSTLRNLSWTCCFH